MLRPSLSSWFRARQAPRFVTPSPGGDGPEPCLDTDPCDVEVAVEAGAVQDGDEVILLPGDYFLGDSLRVDKSINVHGAAGQARPRIVSSVTGVAVEVINAGARLARLGIETGGTALRVTDGGTAERIVAHTTGEASFACLLLTSTLRDSVCWSSATGGTALNMNILANAVLAFTATLRNVTVVATGTTSTGISINASGNAQMAIDGKNVIADGSSVDVSAATANAASATINLSYSNFATRSMTGTGASVTDPSTSNNQTAAPVFVNAAAGDFHQTSGSVATIDLGTADAQNGTTDFDGEARTAGTAIDIGADEYTDTDGDLQPDYLDTDDDADTVADTTDNCPLTSNPGQTDTDTDGAGDACDTDDDGDGIDDTADACPTGAASGTDTDGDGCFDSEDTDDDGDSVEDSVDACPGQPGPASNSGCPVAADTDAPETTIDKAPKKKSAKRKAKLSFSSDETGSTFQCKLDKGEFVPCSSPFKKKVKAGRKHTFEVRATDTAGNVDATPAKAKWRVVEN